MPDSPLPEHPTAAASETPERELPDPVRTRTDAGVLEVTLDRPPANAIDLVTSRRMGEVFAAFRDDPELRVAVLRTAGQKFFSAGWDLKAAAGGDAVDGDYGVGGFGGIQMLPGLDKPILALVEGMAVGGGFELALSCDLIYASTRARFALPEITAGTLADAATLRLPRRIPHHIAMEMLLTGRWMEAQEAQRWGLLNAVLPPQELEAEVFAVAHKLAQGPPLVYAAIKELLRESQASRFEDAMGRISRSDYPAVRTLYASQDQLEGARAFAEKREPRWRGC
ncbi:MAG: enoyl-CoA hydratase-related protein [Micrococcales bacterium]|nr:enoyl-CoA hydratase-related protein [Micrococcales bacterium]